MIKPVYIKPTLLKKPLQATPKSAGQEIASKFQDVFNDVNQKSMEANTKVAEMVAGKSKDIPGAIIAMERSSISMQMFTAVRNKVVSAYEEVMRMQI